MVHPLADDEVASLADEVEVDEAEEVGKKLDYHPIIILYFFKKCLYYLNVRFLLTGKHKN